MYELGMKSWGRHFSKGEKYVQKHKNKDVFCVSC